MGNKAAGGPIQLEVPIGEASGFQVGAAMSGNSHQQGGCTSGVVPSGVADASDGSVDGERAYPSVEEPGTNAAVEAASRGEDSINYTRNNSQSSSGNRLPGSPPAETPSVAEVVIVGELPIPPASETADGRHGRQADVLPPPPEGASSSLGASPPRAPGASDLQLPPLNNPQPVHGAEDAVPAAARGSPSSSADGRDQKGAQ